MNYLQQTEENKSIAAVIMTIIVFFIFSGIPLYAYNISLTETDNQRDIKMKVKDSLDISLEGNPTTGYVWEKIEENDTAIYVLEESKYVRNKPLLGSGGKFVFTFQIIAAGKSRLRLIYHRPFEKNILPANSFEVNIEAK